MSFVNTQYLLHLTVFFVLFAMFLAWQDVKYFKWIKTYWFYERSWMSRFTSLFYLLSIGLMLIALLDLRGPEEKIKSNLPDQRTIIVIDSSSSMLAEDVRPSRFVKSLQLARHFVKNAAGHQIAIVLFSDIQKRLVPFTDDIDLLDSRLSALEKTNSVSGGSNISQAIAESVQYFESEDDQQSLMGNILVFTDAEESEGGMNLELSGSYNLAVVGVGTAKGSNIPLRWEDGSFRGYKTFKGEQVTSRLDETFIKKIGKNVKNYRYWIANSYSLPTDEILSFFRTSFKKGAGKGDVKIRPVFSHLILIPAILLYCLAVIFGRFKTFKTLALVLFLVLPLALKAQEKEKEAKKLSPEVVKDLEKIKSGKASRTHILKTAEKLLREEQTDRASELYKEYAKPGDETAVALNQTTALLKAGKVQQALPLAQKFLNESKDEDAKNKLRNNLLLALKQEDQKKKQKSQQQNKDQQQEQKQDKNQSDKGKDGQEQKDQSKDGKGQDQKDKKDGKQSGDNKSQNSKPSDGKPDDKEEKKDGKPKDPKDLKEPDRESRPQTIEDKEKMIEQKRKMVKTPAAIKQLMSDDRELQKRMMDTSTNERREPRDRRDW